ncbi:Rieske (2Fe-2S) protein [Nonomuraea longicatena]|uniref:Cytochrome bc1 complex Rieske iron-sulfur subunit n=1 Tax=Nonomuraea longicatena TaxID=83682 RepID=A0ABP3ZHE8_9ACTN
MGETTRRQVVLGTGAAGLAAALTGCGGYGEPSGSPSPPAGTGSVVPSEPQNPGAGEILAATGEIPKGGGKVFAGPKVVVTQPEAGRFKCFTAVCTHEGCTVGSVSGGTINCPCHGSKYRITDGTVVRGPAPRPLAEKRISIEGDQIRLA